MKPGQELRFEWNNICLTNPKFLGSIPYAIPERNYWIVSIHCESIVSLSDDDIITQKSKISLKELSDMLKTINKECGYSFISIILVRQEKEFLVGKEIKQFLKEEFDAEEI